MLVCEISVCFNSNLLILPRSNIRITQTSPACYEWLYLYRNFGSCYTLMSDFRTNHIHACWCSIWIWSLSDGMPIITFYLSFFPFLLIHSKTSYTPHFFCESFIHPSVILLRMTYFEWTSPCVCHKKEFQKSFNCL